MHRRTKKSGFTLVELMLAMGFVSILLMSIAILTIQISNIYTKGITLREVNQAGLSVSNDLQRGIEESIPFDTVDPTDGTNTDSEVIQKLSNNVVGGRLCLGKYSYLWNYGDAINKATTNSPLVNRYVNADGSNDTSAPAIRLVKVVDADKSLCSPTNNPGDTNPPVYKNIIHDQTATELLASGDRDLALHDVTISGTKIKPLYAISIVIGTNTDSEIAGTDTCKPPAELQGHQDYCSINRFDIIARAGNKQGSEPSQ